MERLPPRQPPTRCIRPSTFPKRSTSAAHHPAAAVLVEQVDGAAVPAILGQAEPLADLVGQRLVAVAAADGRPGIGQPLGDHRAEPAADPGDRDHAAVQAHSHMGEAGFEPA